MSLVTITNMDKETFLIDEEKYLDIRLGDDTIFLPFVLKINEEEVFDAKIVDCSIEKKVRDENNPNSEGGWHGTVTVHYFVEKQIPYFFDAPYPEMLKEKLRNYYEVPYYIEYVPMLNETDVLFDDTFQSISELIQEAKTKEN